MDGHTEFGSFCARLQGHQWDYSAQPRSLSSNIYTEIQDCLKNNNSNRNQEKKETSGTCGANWYSTGNKKKTKNCLLKSASASFLRGHIAFSPSSRHSSPSSSMWFIPECCSVKGNSNQHFSSHTSSNLLPPNRRAASLGGCCTRCCSWLRFTMARSKFSFSVALFKKQLY